MANSYPKKVDLSLRFTTAMITDVSTPGQIYVVPGFNGRIKKISTVLNGAITVADSILGAKIAGTAVTGSAITVAYSGSAAGDVDFCIPTGANKFTDTQAIELETDGASTTAANLVVTFELEPL